MRLSPMRKIWKMLNRSPVTLAAAIRARPCTGSPRMPSTRTNHPWYSSSPPGNSALNSLRARPQSGSDSASLSLGQAGRSDATTLARLAVSGRRAHHTCRRLFGGFFAALPSRRLSAPMIAAGNHCSMSGRTGTANFHRRGAPARRGGPRAGAVWRANSSLPRGSWSPLRPRSGRYGRLGEVALLLPRAVRAGPR